MLSIRKLLALGLLSTIGTNALAQEWRTAWDKTLYGYTSNTALRGDSLLNPTNQIAHLSQRSNHLEIRMNVKAENDTVRFTARPILAMRESHNAFGKQQHNEAYLSQWQLRVRAAEDWNVAAGREVMNWGTAQFRSPSSPFYFENGRGDPMRELVGMDSVKLTWTPDIQNSVTISHIVGSGYRAAQPDRWRDSWLFKFNQRRDDWTYGMVAVKTPILKTFYGTHAQITLSDSLMLHGEISFSASPYALQSPVDMTQPFSIQTPAPQRSTMLVGTTYTFENGKSLTAEYLHDNHGYTAAEQQAYFQRAVQSPNIALSLAPNLLGRDYLHLVWQSNLMDTSAYWRLMYTHGFTDHGSEISGYGETTITTLASAYFLVTLPQGKTNQEFSSLLQRSLTAGLKFALP